MKLVVYILMRKPWTAQGLQIIWSLSIVCRCILMPIVLTPPSPSDHPPHPSCSSGYIDRNIDALIRTSSKQYTYIHNFLYFFTIRSWCIYIADLFPNQDPSYVTVSPHQQNGCFQSFFCLWACFLSFLHHTIQIISQFSHFNIVCLYLFV